MLLRSLTVSQSRFGCERVSDRAECEYIYIYIYLPSKMVSVRMIFFYKSCIIGAHDQDLSDICVDLQRNLSTDVCCLSAHGVDAAVVLYAHAIYRDIFEWILGAYVRLKVPRVMMYMACG
jgi:hypothetical protein